MSQWAAFREKRNRFYGELCEANRRVSNQTRLAAMSAGSLNGDSRNRQLAQWIEPAEAMDSDYERIREISADVSRTDDESLYREAEQIFSRWNI